MGMERRRHPRFPITVIFDILDGKPSLSGQNRGVVVNLSSSGALFESEAFLAEDQHVYFELPIPIRVWAKVRRARKGSSKKK